MSITQFTIYGEPASKANSRRVAKIKGVSRVIKSDKALEYARSFKNQIPNSARVMLDCDVFVYIRIWYASFRPDLDESLILDCLQAETQSVKNPVTGVVIRHPLRDGVILNDRQVKGKLIIHSLDKKNPRARIVVIPYSEFRLESISEIL